MGISGFFGKNNLTRIIVDLEFPQEIYAKKEFPIKIILKNKRRVLPVFLLKLRINEQNTVFFPFLDTRSEVVKYANISFDKRGINKIQNILIHSVFPFNFFTRYRLLHNTYEFTVFPELIKCDLLTLYEKRGRIKGEKTSDKIGFDPDIISIREYVHGDPLKYINWKATAKTGKLKTRELSSLTYQPIIIDFEKIVINDIEEKISCVAYSILQLLRKNIPIGLKIGSRVYEPNVSQSHKLSVLKELALYESK